MQKPKQVEIVRNVLILAALIGVVLFSWLLGHILRFSIPAFWHPPAPETDPQIRYGAEFEFEGIRRLAIFPGLELVSLSAKLPLPMIPGALPSACRGLTFFTSLPAKCLTTDGQLVKIGGVESIVILIPESK
jgi:hypothetical protein